ncbi:transcriptional Coactivator p15-domain-containing protein [Mycena sp. CBHHK59/15]|nr:transcriptional Coactivator p15-domain-containing protein [Mycena sp. CBHHK59/15]
MAKRKSLSTSDADEPKSSNKPLLKPKPKKLKLEEEEDEDEIAESDDEPLKTKKVPPAKFKAEEPTDVQCTPDGEKFINLGKNKRATVRHFKGNTFIDIREFYTANGEDKPGKKGISLGLEQWEKLKSVAGTLDQLFAEVKG